MSATRRDILAGWSAAAVPGPDGTVAAGASVPAAVPCLPTRSAPTPPRSSLISPLLHMSCMEPLGVTGTGVEAVWGHDADDWRPDFVEAVLDLALKAIRWGGLMSRYCKWREGAGPAAARSPMRNRSMRKGPRQSGGSPQGSASAVELDLA